MDIECGSQADEWNFENDFHIFFQTILRFEKPEKPETRKIEKISFLVQLVEKINHYLQIIIKKRSWNFPHLLCHHKWNK